MIDAAQSLQQLLEATSCDCKAWPAYLNALTVAVLLLKGHEALVHCIRLVLGYVVQGISEDGARPVMLFAALLKLRKLDEELLLQGSLLASESPCCVPASAQS